MERSGPDDAWDDSGDPLYPAAPVPAHERMWRHPSEVGKAAWDLSEPPIAIGRGLLVTTGAIGSALGVAVLWLLSPMSGATPSASPSATSAAAVVRTTEASAPVTNDRVAGTSTVAARPISTIDTLDLSQFTLPAEDVPSTLLVAAPRSEGHASIAVAVGGMPYLLTTATATAEWVDERRTTIDIIDIVAPGEPVSADVVSVDGDLAYLEPSSAVEVVSFADVSSAQPGQTVVVLSDEPVEVTYRADGSAPELDPGIIVEGTPVIDDDGSLVALCTVIIDADGAWVGLVPVAAPPDDALGDDASTDSVPSGSPPPADDPTSTVPGASIDTTTSTAPSGSNSSPAPNAGTAPATTGGVTPSSSTPGAASSTSVASGTSLTTTTTTAAGTSTVPATIAGSAAWAGLRFDSTASIALVVTGVPAGSPAAAAGIAVGDRIVAVDGVTVAGVAELQSQIKQHSPGDVVVFRVVPASTSGPTGSSQTTGTGPATERSITVTLGAVAPSV